LNHFSTVFSFFSTFVSDSGFLEHSKLSQYVTGPTHPKTKKMKLAAFHQLARGGPAADDEHKFAARPLQRSFGITHHFMKYCYPRMGKFGSFNKYFPTASS
jgi:hypothetical protein